METINTASLFRDVGRIIRTRMDQQLPIPFPQCETLRFLEMEKNSTMRAIATHFKIAAPSATAIVNDLVKKKLVVRTENTKDRREVLLRLTPYGKKTFHATTEIRKKIISEILIVLSEKDKKQLNTILSKILIGAESQ